MRSEINGQVIDIEPNSRPHILKRIAADGFDITTVFFAFLILTYLILNTPLANTYNEHYEKYKAIEETVKAQYGDDAEAISNALNGNDEYRNEVFAANLHGYILNSVACLGAETIFLLIIPLSNKNRATLGKQLTGVMVFDPRRQARATWYQAVFRFLFAYLFDSLTLYLFTGVLTFLLVPVLRLIQILLNKKY